MNHSTNGVHLVDIDGTDTPSYEKGIPPHDPTDPENWPESIEFDAIHWEVSDPDERAELNRLAIEAECDRRDQVDPFEPSLADWDEYRQIFDRIDDGFPAVATAADRQQFQADVIGFYASHPGA